MSTAFDLGALNSATKYPSIMTYHELDPKNGKLIEGTAMPFGDGPVILTEKVDGTNGRIVLLPDGDWFIGSREELLYARGDRIENPALGIVPALKPLAELVGSKPPQPDGVIRVLFLEVYGHKIGGAAKQYTTQPGVTGFRLFDSARVEPGVLTWEREKISSWREHGGQRWADENELQALTAGPLFGIPLAPRLPAVGGRDLPVTLAGMQDFLRAVLPQTRVRLDDSGQGQAEGIVLRTPDRALIAKARFQDYDRTLRKQPQRAGAR